MNINVINTKSWLSPLFYSVSEWSKLARHMLLYGILSSVSICYAASYSTGKGQLVSLEFQDAPATVVLQALADYQQLNLVATSGIGGNLSLRLNEVPWEQALAITLRMSRLTVERDGAVMMVFTEQELQEKRL